MVKKAKKAKIVRKKKPRVTLRSLKRDVKTKQETIEHLTDRLLIANKERVDFFHKIDQIEQTAIQMRGEAQRIADITRTLLGRDEQPPPPMTGIMMATQR